MYCGCPNPCTCQLPGIDTTAHFRPVLPPPPPLCRLLVVETLGVITFMVFDGDNGFVIVFADGDEDEGGCVEVALALAFELCCSAVGRKAVVWNPSGASS